MPNYLQRIVTSGARTTSAAKPPVNSRTLIPPIGSSVRMPAGEEESRSAETVPDSVDVGLPAMRASSDVPVQATAKQALVLREPSSTVPEVHIHERFAPEQAHDPVVKPNPPAVAGAPPPLPPLAPAVPGAKVIAPKGLRRGNVNTSRGQRITKVVEETLRTLSPPPTERHPESKTTVSTPTEVVKTDQSEPPLAALQEFPAQPKAKATTVNVIPAPDHEMKAPAGRTQRAVEATSPQIVPSAKMQSAEEKPLIGPEPTAKISQPVPKPLTEKPIVQTRRFEDWVSAPKQHAQRVVPGTVEKRRRSQISIGRIDVQVNNLPPQESTVPAPGKQPGYSNFLEARYLDRFFLKL
jgi:hypothetical protein